MTKSDAMAAYVSLVADINPQWQDTTVVNGDHGEGRGQGGGGGPVVSTLMKDDDHIPDEKKSMFDWCKEGDLTKLVAIVTRTEVDIQDEEV